MSDLQAALNWWDAEGQHIWAGMWQGLDTIVEAARRVADLQTIVNGQAEDEGLWFHTITGPEAYLQQELRRLHAAIESITTENIK